MKKICQILYREQSPHNSFFYICGHFKSFILYQLFTCSHRRNYCLIVSDFILSFYEFNVHPAARLSRRAAAWPLRLRVSRSPRQLIQAQFNFYHRKGTCSLILSVDKLFSCRFFFPFAYKAKVFYPVFYSARVDGAKSYIYQSIRQIIIFVFTIFDRLWSNVIPLLPPRGASIF